ncbi:hypothetical protein [Mucilaginibacter sp.]|jgi:hypothetical protein|uniref:hypothetical protein n=1 Tax=Mucilaginibacter sp. TaxID=1882438 RepID=UPI003568E229
MFKSKLLLVSILLFLTINTLYFWEGILGFFAMILPIVLAITFLILTIKVFYQLYLIVKNRFEEKGRIYKTVIVILLLTLITLRPYGIINYSAFEGENLLVAEREGSANCMTTLMLKENHKFKMRSVCFGIDEEVGTYSIKNDTIKLNYSTFTKRDKNQRFGIIKAAGKSIYLYRSLNDTIPMPLYINKNELKLP